MSKQVIDAVTNTIRQNMVSAVGVLVLGLGFIPWMWCSKYMLCTLSLPLTRELQWDGAVSGYHEVDLEAWAGHVILIANHGTGSEFFSVDCPVATNARLLSHRYSGDKALVEGPMPNGTKRAGRFRLDALQVARGNVIPLVILGDAERGIAKPIVASGRHAIANGVLLSRGEATIIAILLFVFGMLSPVFGTAVREYFQRPLRQEPTAGDEAVEVA